jgi:D-lyxose ketol-isomerase
VPPGLYHSFHSANGIALIGEVSSMNDDVTDNRFYQSLSRFPEIVEDELPFRLLATEYPSLSDSADPASVTQNT